MKHYNIQINYLNLPPFKPVMVVNRGAGDKIKDTSMEENDFVSIWLEESGNPAIEEITRANRETAEKMATFLSDKGLSSTDLSKMLDINHYEVSSWLAGNHAFSIKILRQIAETCA